MLPVDDTALAVTDTRGPGRPVVYLNGSYADQRPWRPVMTDGLTIGQAPGGQEGETPASGGPQRRRRRGGQDQEA